MTNKNFPTQARQAFAAVVLSIAAAACPAATAGMICASYLNIYTDASNRFQMRENICPQTPLSSKKTCEKNLLLELDTANQMMIECLNQSE